MGEELNKSSTFSLIICSKLNEKEIPNAQNYIRKYAYIGENLDVVLIFKFKGEKTITAITEWKSRMRYLLATANVSPLEVIPPRGANVNERRNKKDYLYCDSLLCHNANTDADNSTKRNKSKFEVNENTIHYVIPISLESLPPTTSSAAVHVSIWFTDSGMAQTHDVYLELQPGDSFQDRICLSKQTVTEILPVLPSPVLNCRYLSVDGNHYMALKGYNSFPQDILLHNIRLLPNINDSFLPPNPDGLNVHALTGHNRSEGQFDGNSTWIIPCEACKLPALLSPFEQYCIIFELKFNEIESSNRTDTRKNYEVPLIALVEWSTGNLNGKGKIKTTYRLPRLHVEQPLFSMSAICESPILIGKCFNVNYTLTNNLQDFLAIKLLWNPTFQNEETTTIQKDLEPYMNTVICHQPCSNVGFCKMGSTMTLNVSFSILTSGIFELGHHMKLNLQYTSSAVASSKHHRDSVQSLKGYNFISSHEKRHIFNTRSHSLGETSQNSTCLTSFSLSNSAFVTKSCSPKPRLSKQSTSLKTEPFSTILSVDQIVKKPCQVYIMKA